MLKAYPWLDQSECIGCDIIETGWRPLIERLFADIDAVMAETGAVLIVLQIKEKLGMLRFYRRFRNATDLQIAVVAELVGNAEDESVRTCIACGAPGILENRKRWIACLCAEHANIGPI